MIGRSWVVGATTATPMLRMASAQNTLATGSLAGAANQKMAVRMRRSIGSGDRQDLRVLLTNFIISQVGTAANGADLVIESIYLERCATEQVVQLTFGGASTFSVAADGLTPKVSDPVLPAAFGLDQFSVGTIYAIRAIVTATSQVPIIDTSGSSDGDTAFNYDSTATSCTNISSGGGLVFSGTTPATTLPIAAVLIGTFIASTPDPYTWMVVGDSIWAPVGSSGDLSLSSDLSMGYLPLAGARYGLGGARYECVTTNPAFITQLIPYVSGVIDAMGTNNTGADGFDTVLARAKSTWVAYRAAAVASSTPFKIVRTSLLVITTGTWIAGADPATNQTVASAACDAGGAIDQFNIHNAANAGVVDASGYIDQWVDNAAPIRASASGQGTPGSNYYKWNTTAQYTNDGEHPNATAVPLIARVVRAALPVPAPLILKMRFIGALSMGAFASGKYPTQTLNTPPAFNNRRIYGITVTDGVTGATMTPTTSTIAGQPITVYANRNTNTNGIGYLFSASVPAAQGTSLSVDLFFSSNPFSGMVIYFFEIDDTLLTTTVPVEAYGYRNDLNDKIAATMNAPANSLIMLAAYNNVDSVNAVDRGAFDIGTKNPAFKLFDTFGGGRRAAGIASNDVANSSLTIRAGFDFDSDGSTAVYAAALPLA